MPGIEQKNKKLRSKGKGESPLAVPLIQGSKDPKKPKIPTYREGGHFTDQKLKEKKNGEVIFNPNYSKTTKEILIVKKPIILSPSEEKVVNSLYRFLHEKSDNNNNPSEKDFLKGSGPEESGLIAIGTYQGVRPRSVKFKISELAREFTGKESTHDVSGKEIQTAFNALSSLADKRFDWIHETQKEVLIGKGKKTETRYDIRHGKNTPLVIFMGELKDLTTEERKEYYQGEVTVRKEKEEITVQLSPILIDQIESKYIEKPLDYNRRVILAHGSAKVPSSVWSLSDYLLRELSARRYHSKIGATKLAELLQLDSFIKARQKVRVKEKITEAVETCKRLGIILKWSLGPGKDDEIYYFELNRDFYRDNNSKSLGPPLIQ